MARLRTWTLGLANVSPSASHSLRYFLHDALFGGHAGVDVEVEGGGDGGVAEDNGDGFVVAAAFDAAGCKHMTKGVVTI